MAPRCTRIQEQSSVLLPPRSSTGQRHTGNSQESVSTIPILFADLHRSDYTSKQGFVLSFDRMLDTLQLSCRLHSVFKRLVIGHDFNLPLGYKLPDSRLARPRLHGVIRLDSFLCFGSCVDCVGAHLPPRPAAVSRSPNLNLEREPVQNPQARPLLVSVVGFYW